MFVYHAFFVLRKALILNLQKLVGVTRLEPAASTSRT